jgi:hypothetical protein
MLEGASEPADVNLPSPPSGQRRNALLLGIGGAVGLALGIILTVGGFATYSLFTQTLPSTVESVQVFNELNELRQEINKLNDEKKQKENETQQAMGKALSAVLSTAQAPEGKTPDAGPVAKPKNRKPPGVDPFADLDAEIDDLQRTQKVLNTILDLFTPKHKETPDKGAKGI